MQTDIDGVPIDRKYNFQKGRWEDSQGHCIDRPVAVKPGLYADGRIADVWCYKQEVEQ